MPDWFYPNQQMLQSQYYELEQLTPFFIESMGIQLLELYDQPSYQHSASYTSYLEQPIDEKI